MAILKWMYFHDSALMFSLSLSDNDNDLFDNGAGPFQDCTALTNCVIGSFVLLMI